MKHFIYYPIIAVLALCALGANAQRRGIPALEMQLKDGTRDTLYDSSISMYGLNNASANEYVTAYFPSLGGENPYFLWYRPTSYAWEKYDDMGIIISDTPLPDDIEIPDETYAYGNSNSYDTSKLLFTYLNGKWVVPQGAFLYNGSNQYKYYPRYDYELGKNYYCYGYYRVDGKTYLSFRGKENGGVARLPKTMGAFEKRKELPVSLQSETYAVVVSTPQDAVLKFKNKYGSESPYMEYALADIKKDYAATLTEEQLQQHSDSVEVCDDGHIYFVTLANSYVDRMLTETDDKGMEKLYVHANLSAVLERSDTRNSKQHFCTLVANGTSLEMRECDASWGIKDNTYLTTSTPSISIFSPQVALRVNRVMLPNVTYNINFSIAPQTVDSLPNNKPLQFFACFAEGANEELVDEKFPQIPNLTSANATSDYCLKNPAVTEGTEKEKRTFVASSSEVSTFTVQYTPKTFAYSHAFMVQNGFNAFLTATKAKYEQNIRLIGVEVSPAE